MFVFLPKLRCWNTNPAGDDIRRWSHCELVSNEGGALGDRVCPDKRRTPGSCLTCPQERTVQSQPSGREPHQSWTTLAPDLKLPASELGEINSHCWQATQSMTVWYTSLDSERQLSIWPRGEGHLTSSLLKIGKDRWRSWAQGRCDGEGKGDQAESSREYPTLCPILSTRSGPGMGRRATWEATWDRSFCPSWTSSPPLNYCIREILNLPGSLSHCILESFCYKSLVYALSDTIIWQL